QEPIVFGGMEFELFEQILDTYTARAVVSLPVSDYFLTIVPGYRALAGAAAVARHQARAERERVALAARDRFYGYVGARASLLVAEDAIRLLSANLADVEALAGAGAATPADLRQVQAQLAAARAQRAS